MPKGGKRTGAGRPYGSLQKRHKVIVDDPTALMPVEWMLAVLRDPEAEQSRRDQMAVQAAPYLHAKLNAIAVSSTNGNGGNGGGDVNIVQIIAVPRGGRLDPKSGTITIDGELVTEPPNVEPYQPTPPLELTDQTEQPAPIEPPLPIPEVDTANVERLDAWRKRGDGEPGSSGGA